MKEPNPTLPGLRPSIPLRRKGSGRKEPNPTLPGLSPSIALRRRGSGRKEPNPTLPGLDWLEKVDTKNVLIG